MPEGQDSNFELQPSANQSKQPEVHSERRALRDIVPQRLRDIFSRRQNKINQEAQAETDSPIHPDIEAGAKHILEEGLVKSISIGSINGMRLNIGNLAKAWEQAQKAAGASFEMTDEGKHEIPTRVKEILEAHLQEGLDSLYGVTGYQISRGMDHAITDNPERVAKIFDVANEFGISLTYPVPDDQQAENTPVLLISGDQAVAYAQDIIDLNLPKGLEYLIDRVGNEVGGGLLSHLPSWEEKIENWIRIMEGRGWTVVDAPASAPISQETHTALIARQINKGDVRASLERAVRDNLAKGARDNIKMVAYKLKTGLINPLSPWGNPENIELYAEAGRKYGLVHQGGIVGEKGDVESDLYFDPSTLPEQIKEAVIANLPAGIQALQDFHLSDIRKADLSAMAYREKALDQYLHLTSEYGVPVNADFVRASMRSHVSSENLSEGVKHIAASIKEDLRKGEYTWVSVNIKRVRDLRKLCAERGFAVDFSELDKYLEQTALHSPQLTEAQQQAISA